MKYLKRTDCLLHKSWCWCYTTWNSCCLSQYDFFHNIFCSTHQDTLHCLLYIWSYSFSVSLLCVELSRSICQLQYVNASSSYTLCAHRLGEELSIFFPYSVWCISLLCAISRTSIKIMLHQTALMSKLRQWHCLSAKWDITDNARLLQIKWGKCSKKEYSALLLTNLPFSMFLFNPGRKQMEGDYTLPVHSSIFLPLSQPVCA